MTIEHNGDRIIEANLTSENPVSIEPGRKLEFTYSVHWISTTKPFEKRFDRYLEYDFFEHRIHWFSVFNSFMMVVFLCGLVGLILLRTLRNDFAKYSKDEDLDVEGLQVIGEDTGWKQIHGDVFRAPHNLVLFSALLGSGWQLSFLVFGVILYAMAGKAMLHSHIFVDKIKIFFSLRSVSTWQYVRRSRRNGVHVHCLLCFIISSGWLFIRIVF